MTKLKLFFPSLCACLLATAPGMADNSATSLQDLGAATWKDLPKITLYPAREVLTLDAASTTTEAVAVVGDRILATGTLEELKEAVGDQPYRIDETFNEKIIVPGFIAQHDHPLLGALTMSSEILSIEDWELPNKFIPAVKDKEDFMTRLAAAEQKMSDPDEPLFSWGYHSSFFGKLTRSDLNKVSKTRPIIILVRSCHDLILNDAALEQAGINEESMSKWTQSRQEQSSLEDGHFWEQGLYGALETDLLPMIFSPERFHRGLLILRDYMHSKGITFGNEPGGLAKKPIQDGVNSVFSQPTMPFRWTFMVDGKTMCSLYKDDAQVLIESEKQSSWFTGFTSQAEKSVKLFADGAIFSQMMVLREPYLDNHEGEWMTDLDVFQRAFRIYWDADYQIHVHVNGDGGLDRVLNTLEENIRRHPRHDHRTTIVHFAVSAKDQVDRMKRLGCIVSGNPYYVTALADNYSEVGLGPERADQMVRMGDVERAGISFSYHGDMPMAPCDPLFLMWCGVNRITVSGRVAGENQKVSREAALRAVTSEAAYSLRMEKELGTIESGKLANLTILDGNPITCDPMKIKDISVWGTIHEGRVLPVSGENAESAKVVIPPKEQHPVALSAKDRARMLFSRKPSPSGIICRTGCSCGLGKALASAYVKAMNEGRLATR